MSGLKKKKKGSWARCLGRRRGPGGACDLPAEAAAGEPQWRAFRDDAGSVQQLPRRTGRDPAVHGQAARPGLKEPSSDRGISLAPRALLPPSLKLNSAARVWLGETSPGSIVGAVMNFPTSLSHRLWVREETSPSLRALTQDFCLL